MINKIIVTRSTFSDISMRLRCYPYMAIDTETTGLKPYKGDRLFSIIVTVDDASYYFNFNEKPDHNGDEIPEEYVLDKILISRLLAPLFYTKERIIFLHNAKFDLHMLYFNALRTHEAKIYCTEALARICNNQLPNYKLSTLGKAIGFEKDDTVEKYITKHKLFTDVDEGKKKATRYKHYDLVPFDIISNYGMQDGIVTLELGKYILKRIDEIHEMQLKDGVKKTVKDILEVEAKITKVLFKMENVGVKINRALCEEALEYELEKMYEAEEKFLAFTGVEYEDASTVLQKAFKAVGLNHGYTEKGNPSFSDENLPNNTLGDLIREIRSCYKRANTYYRNFLLLADDFDLIHCNFKQSGTLTGRMSCTNPNLQNIPKRGEDDNKYKIRSCFVPRDGYFFVMIDFDQMEYRLMLDIAGEDVLINKILDEGVDVHTATAEEIGCQRNDAKAINFGLLYGQGAKALAEAIGESLQGAKSFIQKYFSKLRQVERLINRIKQVGKQRGYITNVMGRYLLAPSNYIYKLPNHYIQGGCGDIVKVAMLEIDEYIEKNNLNSRMILQVHDELIIEVKEGEEDLVVNQLKEIMQNAYKHISLPLTCGIDYSKENWHNKNDYDSYN